MTEKSNADTWKAVKGWQLQGQGKVVIKGVDRERCVTIGRIAVPLKVGTAMATEMMGVCVFAGILDLVFHKCLCVYNINRCINTIMKKRSFQRCERLLLGQTCFAIPRSQLSRHFVSFCRQIHTALDQRAK